MRIRKSTEQDFARMMKIYVYAREHMFYNNHSE